MANSRDYSERLWAWLGWHTNVGDANRDAFETYVDMKNKWALGECISSDLKSPF